MLAEITIGVLTLFIVIYVYFQYQWRYFAKQGVYFIKPSFPWGSVPAFFDKSEAANDVFLKHAKEVGNMPFYGIYVLRKPMFVIKDAELVRHICVKDFDHFVDRAGEKFGNFFKTQSRSDHLWASQISNARGELWKNLRSTFSPIFTSGKMKAMMIFMQETMSRLMNELDGFAKSGESFELKDSMGKYSMDTIASCAFGVDSQSFTNKNSLFAKFASNIFAQRVSDGLKILMVTLIPYGVQILNALKISVSKETETEFFYEAIMSSLRERRKSKNRRNDLVDLMMDAIKGDIEHDKDGEDDQFEKDAKLNHVSKRDEFDELTIVATAIVILVAGYDTTGTTLAYVCYQLAKNPEVQNRLRDEVLEITNDSDRDLTYDDLNKMTYMDQVISETLRFHNPVSVLQRYTLKDYKIPGTEVVIPKDIGIFISTVAVHMDPKNYANPHKFDPEHFSKKGKASRSPYAFLPFGQGPRNCLGMRFALLEAKLALANIVRNYNLIPSEKTKEPLELDPKAAIGYVKGGLFIKAEKL